MTLDLGIDVAKLRVVRRRTGRGQHPCAGPPAGRGSVAQEFRVVGEARQVGIVPREISGFGAILRALAWPGFRDRRRITRMSVRSLSSRLSRSVRMLWLSAREMMPFFLRKSSWADWTRAMSSRIAPACFSSRVVALQICRLIFLPGRNSGTPRPCDPPPAWRFQARDGRR